MAQRGNEDLFDSYFRRADLDGDGQISGAEAVGFFQGSNLPKHVLAQVWMHADQKKVGFLTRLEFYNALKLVTVAQSKRELTPDIVKAALYGPASAKIPAPQINLAATPAPQSKAAAPGQQMGVTTPAPSGIRAPQNVGNVSFNQHHLLSQPNQFTRPPQAMSPTASQPQQAITSQGTPRGVTAAPPRPANTTGSTDWPSGTIGSSFGVNSQVTSRAISPSTNQDAFGLTASGLTSSVNPRPQMTTGQTTPMPQKSQETPLPSNQVANKDGKTLVASGNGFAPDSLFGDVFSVTLAQPKQNQMGASSSVTTSSGPTGAVRTSDAPQTSIKPGPLESYSQHPVAGQHHHSQSAARPVQQFAGQSITASSTAVDTVVAGNPAPKNVTQSQPPWPKMTQADIQKYTKVFVQVDTDRDGKITGEQARNLFLSWRLPREVLKQVWDLSDQDDDSMLSLKEFCVALYLMERFREGRPLPDTVPSNIMPGETQFSATGQTTAPHSGATWGQAPGFQQPHAPNSSRPPAGPRGKPPRPGQSVSQGDDQPKSRVPVLEKHLVDQLSKEEQESLNSKLEEATAVDKKVQELEKEIAESKQKIEYFHLKMQELILYKSRCDNRFNEITERVSADKREVESLGRKYEQKYKQAGGVASKLTIEEATFRDIQEKKMELYQAIVKIEEGDTADNTLQERAERIQSSLEELIKNLNERCKQYGLRGKPTSLVELPFGWQPGIQEGAADWDEDWDKFEDEGFTFVKELTLDVENVVAPPKPKSFVRKETTSSTHDGLYVSSTNGDKSEKVSSTGESIPEKELASEQEDASARSPPESPVGNGVIDNQSHDARDSNNEKSSDADGSPHVSDARSDRGGAESIHSGGRRFDEPSWGTFDSQYDTDSVWGFDSDGNKDMDHDKHNDISGFGLGEFNIKPIKTGSSFTSNLLPGKSSSLFADSVPSTPAYNFDTVPATPAYNFDTVPASPAYNFDSIPASPAYKFDNFASTPAYKFDSVPGTPAYNFADSVPGTPAYNFGGSPRRFDGSDFGSKSMTTETPRTDNLFAGKSSAFADSVPSTPAYNFGKEDNSFDSFSRFDSFNMHDSGFSTSPRKSFDRFDSVRSTSESDVFPSRFDSFNASRFDSFNAHDSGHPQSPQKSLARFDSMSSTKDSDYSHGFSTFDDTDPFGSSGPFKTSLESQTPKRNSDNWSAF